MARLTEPELTHLGEFTVELVELVNYPTYLFPPSMEAHNRSNFRHVGPWVELVECAHIYVTKTHIKLQKPEF